MKDYVIGFLFGVVFVGMLCVIVPDRRFDNSAPRTQVSAMRVQYVESEAEELFFEERALRDLREPTFTLPPMPRFRPAPPIYNWQLPCP